MLITSKEELLKMLEEKAVLKDALIKGVDLSGIELKVYGFENCSFNESNLSGAYVKDCSFKNCEFFKADLSKSVIKSTHFENCVFHQTSFKQAEIERTLMRSCDLEWSDFSYAKIKGVTTTLRTKGLTTINLESVGTLEKVVTYVVEMDRVFIGCWEGTPQEFYEKSEEVMEKSRHFNLPIAIATIKEAVKLYGKGE